MDTKVRFNKVSGGWNITASVTSKEHAASYTVKGFGHTRREIQEARDLAIARATEVLDWLSTDTEGKAAAA